MYDWKCTYSLKQSKEKILGEIWVQAKTPFRTLRKFPNCVRQTSGPNRMVRKGQEEMGFGNFIEGNFKPSKKVIKGPVPRNLGTGQSDLLASQYPQTLESKLLDILRIRRKGRGGL